MTAIFKHALVEKCKHSLNKKIDVIVESLKQAQEALENETKSSAGDKYETSREMIQQDLDRLQRQLATLDKDRITMEQIGREVFHASKCVQLGSLVETDRASYLVAVSLGRLENEEVKIYVISPQSPIGALLMGSKAGDVFSFNGIEQKIVNIE